MDKYHITLNQRAFRDIEDIFAYIALEKLSPENAKGQTDRIWDALKTLDTFPQSHQERNEGAYAGKGYRQLIIDNYLAIFKIDENTKTVSIITVQYQGRDL
jgi:toxin ParE1/3/4